MRIIVAKYDNSPVAYLEHRGVSNQLSGAAAMRKHVLVLGAVVLGAVASLRIMPASAQTGQFWIDWDNVAKKCIVVTKQPADKKIEDGGPFKTQAEAQAAFKNVKGCS